MKLLQLKSYLEDKGPLTFNLKDGSKVPAHFHITEVGLQKRESIDCGGASHYQENVVLQLWSSIDLYHRMDSAKLLKILTHTEKQLSIPNAEVIVEYQTDTLGIYKLGIDGGNLLLENTSTDCKALNTNPILANSTVKSILCGASSMINKVANCC